MEDYKRKYEEVLKRIKECVPDNNGFITIYPQEIFPELRESKDERIRKALIRYFTLSDEHAYYEACGVSYRDIVAWLEKQGEQNSSFESFWNASPADTFFIEHGKYYYCIEDYYSGGCKRATKGDVVQALSGMPMMSLNREEATKYFIPVNSIEQKSAEWSEEDEKNCLILQKIICDSDIAANLANKLSDWLKSLKNRYTWKPSKEQIIALRWVLNNIPYNKHKEEISGLLDQIKDL